MSQLLMHRPDLAGLPPLAEPPGFHLRPFRASDLEAVAQTLSLAFEEQWTVERVERELTSNAFVQQMFVIALDDTVVATASAAYSEDRPGVGYVHYVAARPSQAGNRLGYWVTLAVLHEFASRGYAAAILNTDDFRLPAIKTYLNLGFKPAIADITHPSRWQKVLEELAHPAANPTGNSD